MHLKWHFKWIYKIYVSLLHRLMYITSLSLDGIEHYETVPYKPMALHVLPLQSDDSNVPK